MSLPTQIKKDLWIWRKESNPGHAMKPTPISALMTNATKISCTVAGMHRTMTRQAWISLGSVLARSIRLGRTNSGPSIPMRIVQGSLLFFQWKTLSWWPTTKTSWQISFISTTQLARSVQFGSQISMLVCFLSFTFGPMTKRWGL